MEMGERNMADPMRCSRATGSDVQLPQLRRTRSRRLPLSEPPVRLRCAQCGGRGEGTSPSTSFPDSGVQK